MAKLKGVVNCLLIVSLLGLPLANAGETKRSDEDLKRDKASKGIQVTALAGVKPGMKVLDLLGGSGYYSEILAERVGASGQVYLHNNSAYLPYVEKGLVARLANNRLPNVKRFDKELGQLDLANNQFDSIFFILGYHDIYHVADGWKVDRAHLLKQLQAGVRKGGTLVIVDHAAKTGTGTQASQDLHRIDKQYVINEITELGFELVNDSALLANPKDMRTISPFDPSMRRKTERFVLVFKKS